MALPKVIIRVFKRVGSEMETEVRVMWPGAKEYRQLVDAGKGKKIDIPLELPEGNVTLILAQ